MSEALFNIGEVSRRTGVSTDLIRAWERRYDLLQPRRSASNFRLYTAADIARLRLMRHYTEQNIPRWQAAELVRQAASTGFDRHPGIPPADVDNVLAVLHDALERFDAAPAEVHLHRLGGVFTSGVILRDVVLPYLHELGERWACGEATVAQEHFASCVLESWMLGRARGWGRAGARRALLACVPGEQHALGLIAFGVALRELQWSITFLGRDTPVGALRHAADKVRPDAVVLSAVVSDALAAGADELAEFARGRPVVIGGAATRTQAAAPLEAFLLPFDLLSAARVLTARHIEAGAQAAGVPRGARGSGSGTASTSAGTA